VSSKPVRSSLSPLLGVFLQELFPSQAITLPDPLPPTLAAPCFPGVYYYPNFFKNCTPPLHFWLHFFSPRTSTAFLNPMRLSILFFLKIFSLSLSELTLLRFFISHCPPRSFLTSGFFVWRGSRSWRLAHLQLFLFSYTFFVTPIIALSGFWTARWLPDFFTFFKRPQRPFLSPLFSIFFFFLPCAFPWLPDDSSPYHNASFFAEGHPALMGLSSPQMEFSVTANFPQ